MFLEQKVQKINTWNQNMKQAQIYFPGTSKRSAVRATTHKAQTGLVLRPSIILSITLTKLTLITTLLQNYLSRNTAMNFSSCQVFPQYLVFQRFFTGMLHSAKSILHCNSLKSVLGSLLWALIFQSQAHIWEVKHIWQKNRLHYTVLNSCAIFAL